ncbi:hypothetical protein R1flu_018504 [Riccia fluitans]|uniref:Uncharacterized protein n=1 Tax=Riccia fluitans TaxID=41844 RepID=A0ABD1ZIB0_9MARC
MKGKVQFTELQLLKLMKGDKWLSKPGVLLEQVKGNPDFIPFCQILNSVFAPPTCLGPYLAHLYLHFNEWHNEKMEGPKKQKACEKTVPDSDTEMEEEVKAKSESLNMTWIGEANASKPLDTMMIVDFKEWDLDTLDETP